MIHGGILKLYREKRERLGDDMMNELERSVMLHTIDEKWIEHLYAMDHLKEGIGLRAYGQVNPLVAYQKESFDLFEQMKDEIRSSIIRLVLLVEVVQQRRSVAKSTHENVDEVKSGGGGGASQAASRGKSPAKNREKVGRNDPCPCGSGKKYKKCCMDKQ